jgi:hypothetical protein
MISRSLLSLFIIASVVSTAGAADQLQWKLSTGDSLKYAVQNEMATTATVGGFDNKTRLTQTMYMVWDVKTLTAKGSYLLSQVIDRIRVEMAPNEETSVVFDSGRTEPSDAPDDQIVRSLGNVFRKIVNREFMITMAPTGAMEDVVIPTGLLETLKMAAAGTSSGLDEKALKQMLSQTSVILPAKPVANGDQWQSQQTVELPFATLHMDATMTYKGVDEDGLAVIDYVPNVTLKPKKDTLVQFALRKSQGTGKVLFDIERGRVARMQLNLQMEMQTEVRGQQVVQKIDQQTVMVLQD